MVKTKTMLAQLIARAVIFFLFLLGLFIVVPGLRYIFILFIILNIVLGFINGKKNIFINIIFVLLTPWLFFPILEYMITAILVVLLGIHLLRFFLWFRKGGVVEKKKEKKDEEKKKFPRWLIIVLILAGVFFLFLILVALAFAGFSSVSTGVQVAG